MTAADDPIWGRAIDGLRAEDDRAARASFVDPFAPDPEEEANTRRLSEESGLPAAEVRLAPDVATRAAQANRASETLRAAPRLRDWLSEPGNADVARDDVETLAEIERIGRNEQALLDWDQEQRRNWEGNPVLRPFRGLLNIPRGLGRPLAQAIDTTATYYRSGQEDQEQFGLERRSMQQAEVGLSDAEAMRLDELREREQPEGGTVVIRETARMVPLLEGMFGRTWEEISGQRSPAGAYYQTPAGRAALAAGRANPNDLMQGRVGEFAFDYAGEFARDAYSLVGATPGSGLVTYIWDMEAAGVYSTLRAQGVPHDVAADAAEQTGALASAVEVFGAGLILGRSGVGELADDAAGLGVRQAIRNVTMRAALSRAGVRGAEAAFIGGAEEGIQESIAISTEAAARARSGVATPEGLSPGERIAESLRAGMEGGVGLGSPVIAANLALDVRAVRRAQQNQQVFEQLGFGVQNSLLRQRLPSAMRQAVDAMTEGTAVETIRIDADAFAEYYHGRGIRPEEAAAQIGVTPEALNQALESGADIEVRMGQFAAHIAGSPDYAQLIRHARFRPGDFTQAEMEAAAQIQDRVGEIMDATVKQTESVSSLRETIETRMASLFEQARQEGGPVSSVTRRYTRLMSAMPETVMARLREGVARGETTQEYADSVEQYFRDFFERRFDVQGPERAAEETGRGQLEQGGRGASAERRAERWTPPEGVRLSDRERSYVEMARNNFTNEEIAEEWDTSAAAVKATLSSVARKLGGPVWEQGRRPGPTSPASIDQIMALRLSLIKAGHPVRGARDGETVNAIIAKRLDISANSVSQRVSRELARRRSEGGELYSLGGERSSNMDDDALSRAIEMTDLGHTPEEIWRETGWWKNPVDEKWRYEIDDTNATFITVPGPRVPLRGKLVDILRFPELFMAYPSLKDVAVEISIGRNKRREAYYDEEAAAIVIETTDAPDAFSILLHEVQHAIQAIEGFAKGGNPDMAHDYVFEILEAKEQARQAIVDQRFAGDRAKYDGLEIQHPQIFYELEQSLDERATTRIYLRFAGEMEARAVQRRRGDAEEGAPMATRLNSEQRRQVDPSQSYDLALDQAIIPFEAGENYVAIRSVSERNADIGGVLGEPPAGPARAEGEGPGVSETGGRSSDGARGARAAQTRAHVSPTGRRDLDEILADLDAAMAERPAFYSAVERALSASKTARAPGAQWWATISKTPGVKREELEWIGLEDFLKGREGQVSREEVLAFVQQNGVRVEETVLGGEGVDPAIQQRLLPLLEERERLERARDNMQAGPEWDATRARILALSEEITPLQRQANEQQRASAPKWSQYTLPGGENYRELLLRLPVEKPTVADVRETRAGWRAYDAEGRELTPGAWDTPEQAREMAASDLAASWSRDSFRSSHFEQPNILAHVRFNERIDANGKRTLFIEEVQSDWHQKGREWGYQPAGLDQKRARIREIEALGREATAEQRQEWADLMNQTQRFIDNRDIESNTTGRRGVPDAPFKNNAWANLALKRMIRWAAENGFEQIAWTRGQHQIERFNVEKVISALRYERLGDGTYYVRAYGKDGMMVSGLPDTYAQADLAQTFGKEIAKQIVDGEGQGVRGQTMREIKARDLRVGGEGMRAFYDKIMVNIANDLGKKFGARTGETGITADKEGWHITPPDQTVSGRWMVKSSNYNSQGLHFDTEAEARAALAEKQAPALETVHSLPITESMREAAMEGQALFARDKAGRPIGGMSPEFDADGKLREAVIRLYAYRDGRSYTLSTFLHETGHLFLELMNTVASDAQAPQALRGIWNDTLNWFGLTQEQWASFDLEAKRAHHERFAEAFEAYLLEGNAPSVGLREAFQAFKAWLKRIYNEMFARERLDPQIRDIFDRMLATDQEIAEARAEMGGDFSLAREAFPSEADFQAYQEAIRAAQAAVEDDVRSQAMDVHVRRGKRQWRNLANQERAAATRAVDSDPARRAHDWLAFGEWRDLPETVLSDEGEIGYTAAANALEERPEGLPEMRLDANALEAEYGPEIFGQLPRGLMPFSMADKEAALAEAMALKRQGKVRQPQRLAAFIKARGGIKDEGGEIKQALGSGRAYPGLINANGMNADDLALLAWEAGYFGVTPRRGELAQDPPDINADRRPTPRELLDLLISDLRGEKQVFSIRDEEAVAAWQNRSDAVRWFEARGIDLSGKKDEIAAQIEAALSREVEGGVDPDTAASWFGFSSGDEMIQSLKGLKPRNVAIEEEIARRLEAQYGDPVKDGTLEEAARLAAHSEVQGRKLEIELGAIQRATGQRRTPVSRAARAAAERAVANMTVKDVRGFDRFLAAERRSARNALEATQRQDWLTAETWKLRQINAFWLYRLSREAATEMDRAQNYFGKFARPTIREKFAPHAIKHLDQIDQMLEGIDLRRSPRMSERRRQSFIQWMDEMKAEGLEHLVVADEAIVEAARRVPFQNLTLEQARGLRDAIRNIEHIGRRWREVLGARDQRLLEEEIAVMAANMGTVKPIELANAADHSPGVLESLDERRQKFHAVLSRMEFVFFAMDGYKYGGPIQQRLMQPLRDARGREEMRQESAQQAIEDLLSVYTAKERADMWTARRFYPQVPNTRDPTRMGVNLTKQEILSIALNTGNDYNLNALLAGWKWSPGQVQKLLDDTMDARDWRFVQSVWDYVDSFWPDIAALYERTTGVVPPKVEARPFQNRHGEWRGGYYHLQYDWGRDQRARDEYEYGRVQEAFGGPRLSSQTPNGFTKARQGSGGRPVLLDLSVLTEHVNGVIHDLEFRVPVLDAWRLIKHPEFRAAFVRAAGQAQYDQLKPWLQYIATERMPPENIVTGTLKLLRQNTPIALMGYSLSTVVQQPAGLLGTFHRLGTARVMGELVQTVAQPWTWMQRARFVNSRSTFMRNRTRISQREIREMAMDINAKGNMDAVNLFVHGNLVQKAQALAQIKRVMGKHALYPLAYVDKITSSIPWMVAYKDAIAGRVANVDPQSEKAAVDYADHIIATTFGSGRPEDMPAIMRSGELGKLITPAFSYFSTQYNQLYNEQLPGMMRGRISPLEFMTFIIFTLAVQQLLSDWLAGRWEEDDEDEEEQAVRLAADVSITPLAGVPIVRDIARGVARKLSTGQPPRGDMVPAFGAITSTTQAIGGTIDGVASGDGIDRTTARAIVMSSGYWFGAPSNAMWKFGEGVTDIATGEDDLSDPAGTFQELFIRDQR